MQTFKFFSSLPLNRGAASAEVIIILFIAFFIFLLFMLFNGSFNPQNLNATKQTASALPSLSYDTGGGLRTLEITPLPSTFSPSMCNVLTNDVVLTIDNSGSMKGSKLVQAKEAAKMFVQLIAINPASRVSVVVFNKTASVASPLTSDLASLNTKIDSITEGSNTCIQCGAVIAAEQFTPNLSASPSATVKRSIVLLSDGKANHVNGQRSNNAKQAAQDAIQSGYSSNGASYYTIAIGEDADTQFMEQIASTTKGAAFSSSSYDVLANTFATVATDICTN